ncbi:MAG: hypothetical protein WCP46_03000 [Alphaproteobacteria bacterium]
MAIHSNSKPSGSVYALSYHGYDQIALNAAKALAVIGNIEGSVISANLLIHRYKKVDLGFEIYGKAIQCIDNTIQDQTIYVIDTDSVAHPTNQSPSLATAKIAILDNQMRMIHHHPALVKHPISESLKLHKQILSLDPDYTSPEVAIMYDVTLGDHQRGRYEYQKFLTQRQSYSVGGEEAFWLFDIGAIKLLIGSLDNLLAGQPNSCDHPNFAEFLEHSNTTDPEQVQFFCDSMSLTNVLRADHYNQTSIKEFLVKNANNYVSVLKTYYFSITGLTIASNSLAGKDPELALKLLQIESEWGYQDARYAVGDFQLNPATELVGEFNATDFLPAECR